MSEDQVGVKPYIFNLYPEENQAVQAFAKAHCRGNRSEALRRMIAYAALTFGTPGTPITEHNIAGHPAAELR